MAVGGHGRKVGTLAGSPPSISQIMVDGTARHQRPDHTGDRSITPTWKTVQECILEDKTLPSGHVYVGQGHHSHLSLYAWSSMCWLRLAAYVRRTHHPASAG